MNGHSSSQSLDTRRVLVARIIQCRGLIGLEHSNCAWTISASVEHVQRTTAAAKHDPQFTQLGDCPIFNALLRFKLQEVRKMTW